MDPANTIAEALRGARLVIAAVGSSAARELVQGVAPQLTRGQIFLNLSRIPTAEHLESAALVQRQGALYIAGLADTPLLLAGARADSLASALETLGCPARAIASEPQCLTSSRSVALGADVLSTDAAAGATRRCELP